MKIEFIKMDETPNGEYIMDKGGKYIWRVLDVGEGKVMFCYRPVFGKEYKKDDTTIDYFKEDFIRLGSKEIADIVIKELNKLKKQK